MRRSAIAATFPFTLVTSLAIVVACGPKKDYVPVNFVARSPLAQAVDDCKSEIRKGKGRSIGPSGQEVSETGPLTTRICEADRSNLTQEEPDYKYVPYDVRYRVSNEENRFKISMNIAINIQPETPRDIQAGMGRALKSCLRKLTALGNRSMVDLNTEIQIEVGRADLLDPDEVDHVLDLVSAAKKENNAHPEFVIAGWPEVGTLYPLGRKEDYDKCQRQAQDQGSRSGNARVFQSCLREPNEKANERFCRAFAMRVGHWLGLKPDAEFKSFNARCDAKGARVGADSDLKGRKRSRLESRERQALVRASFLTMASEPDVQSEEFWKTARFSKEDVVTILSPACRSVKKLANRKTSL